MDGTIVLLNSKISVENLLFWPFFIFLVNISVSFAKAFSIAILAKSKQFLNNLMINVTICHLIRIGTVN